MTVQICSCKGLNSKCEKCFGSGYINLETGKKSSLNHKEKKSGEKGKLNSDFRLPENIDSLDKTELVNNIYEIIARLDFRSKKQMQLLNAIPFSATNFRRDFKDKFAILKNLEEEKIGLRNDLHTITQLFFVKKYSGNFRFKHFLSDKNIDVESNRALKDLIKEYKKIKSGAY